MTPETRKDLADVFEALLRGDAPTAVQISTLSLLEGADLDRVREVWPQLSTGQRQELVGRAAELAEDDVTLDFVALARLAAADESADVRRRAVEALWETDDRHVARELVELLRDDGDEQVREAAADSLAHYVVLREFGEFDARQGDELIGALRDRVEDVDEAIPVRARALEALGAWSEPWVDSLMTNAYYHDDQRMRVASFLAMTASAHEKWLEYVYDGLNSDDAEIRFHAAAAAGAIGAEEAVDSVAVLLDDEDSEVAMAAINALGEIGGSSSSRYLREFADRVPPGLEDELAEALDVASLALEDEDYWDDDEQD